MRTSRTSRDAGRLFTNLATRPPRSLRQGQAQTIQSYSFNAADVATASNVALKKETVSDHESDPSSALPDLNDAIDPQHMSSTTSTTASMAGQKRKRGGERTPARAAATTTSASKAITTSVTIKSEDGSPSTDMQNGSAHEGVAAPVETAMGKVKPRKARRAPAKKKVEGDGTIKVEPPANWEEMYAFTKDMRAKLVAPVDTMGCDKLAEEDRPPRDQRLQTLVALMLSSQTKDTVTSEAMKNMQRELPGGLTLESLLEVEPDRLNELISKVGFHNNKTRYIKATAEILRSEWDGDIPDTIEGLTSLPGVGPKMAYLCMSSAWGRDEGIGVDVHVHRITNLWGWHKTKTPEETRIALQAWLPKDKWHDINHLLVGFGQTICLPVGKKCGECTLAENGLCPSAVVARAATKVKQEKVVIKKEENGEESFIDTKNILVTEQDIKAEDVQDIEDIGIPPKRTSRRRAR